VRWLSADGSWLSRLLLQRALAGVYAVAFLVARNQFPALLGERGLTPVPRYLRLVSFRRAPSLFHWHYSDRALRAVAWTGVGVAVACVVGLPERGPLAVSMLAWALLWVLYLSIVNVGQVWYGFGWESLLLEAGFLAIFLGSAATSPPVLILWAFRWLLFRLEFGAGLIKLRGDPCWRNLTCLQYHHETQPMPNPLSWRFHHLPAALHRVEVLANHGTQLVVPWFLFAPQPLAGGAAVVVVVTQGWLVLSGNFSWLNVLTMTLACAAMGLRGSPPDLAAPAWHQALVVAVGVLVVVLSWWPVRNMIGRRGQAMNASFNQLHLVNTYGAFGSVTKVRHEIVIEGTDETGPAATWREYEFKGKPGDVRRRPPQVAPYHLRLDWLMWFAALSPAYADAWFAPLLHKLLEGDEQTLRLVRVNPFSDDPPAVVRARLYRYRFTTRAERKESGAYWHRTLVGDYAPAVSLRGISDGPVGPDGRP
jgi:hypothetical protein